MINIGDTVLITSIDGTGLVMEGTKAKSGRIVKYVGNTGKIIDIHNDGKYGHNKYEILITGFGPLPLLFPEKNLKLFPG